MFITNSQSLSRLTDSNDISMCTAEEHQHTLFFLIVTGESPETPANIQNSTWSPLIGRLYNQAIHNSTVMQENIILASLSVALQYFIQTCLRMSDSLISNTKQNGLRSAIAVLTCV